MLEKEAQDLLRQAKAGDRGAFEKLIDEYRTRLGSMIFFRLGAGLRSKTEVDDVVQETLLRALQSLERFELKGPDSFFGWLRSIAEHVILEVAGREKRRGTAHLDTDVAVADDTAPSRALRREERFGRLQEAIRSLSPDYRRVILLAKVERRPIKDIAVEMDRSPDAVSNLLARALSKLKEQFGDTESLHLPDRLLDEDPGQVASPPERPTST